MKIIRAKERGDTVAVAEEEPETEAPVDLLAALRESVEAAGKRGSKAAALAEGRLVTEVTG